MTSYNVTMFSKVVSNTQNLTIVRFHQKLEKDISPLFLKSAQPGFIPFPSGFPIIRHKIFKITLTTHLSSHFGDTAVIEPIIEL